MRSLQYSVQFSYQISNVFKLYPGVSGFPSRQAFYAAATGLCGHGNAKPRYNAKLLFIRARACLIV